MALVTIGRFRDPIDAQVRKALLEGADIPAFVADEHLISTQWLYSTAVGGVRLQVPAEHEEEARELLRADDVARLAEIPESGLPPGDGDACPACGSVAVRPSHSKRSALALSLLLELPLPFWRRRWVCSHCGHSWRMSRTGGHSITSRTARAERLVQGRPGSYLGIAIALGLLAALFIIQYVLKQPTRSW